MLTTQITGQVIAAKISSFTDQSTKQNIDYGKIQIMHKDMSGEFYAITNIKVRASNFDWIPDIAKLISKTATLSLEQQLYNGKASLFLAAPVTLEKAS